MFSRSAIPFRAFTRHGIHTQNQRFTLFESKHDNEQETEGHSAELVRSLDLYPIFSVIAAHAGTRRGYQTIMAYVNHKDATAYSNSNSPVSSKRRRASGSEFGRLERHASSSRLPIAKSVQEARKLYEMTEEAVLALTRDNVYKLTYPPIYGEDSGPFDTKSLPSTDYDDWLHFSTIEEWTLEHILQAEKVLEMLLQVHQWAGHVQTWMPHLAAVGLQIDAFALKQVWEEICGSVKFVRVRSITDPSGRNSYAFRINHEKFPVLGIMEEKVNEYRSSGASESKILDMTTEIEIREKEIKDGLVRIICGQLRAIDEGLDKVGRIDTSFAKAAFGEVSGGQIPLMDSCGCIDVKQFLHPLLMRRMDHTNLVVPIDLQVSNKKPILICSGANGGGKTIAMKSFGIASVFSKTGVPIPIRGQRHERPRVDFFDEIHVSIGDGQDPENGQSTFTAQLAKYSNILVRVLGQTYEDKAETESTSSNSLSHLIIMDELGAGTDANAGGAIAQAVLEKLSEATACRYECAAVLLKTNDEEDFSFSLPAFQLQYGIIGESYALGAASRCSPPLPVDVLQRAERLNTQEADNDMDVTNYSTMNRSLQKQLRLAEEARDQADCYRRDMEQIRRSMLALASSYDEHFKRLESRLTACYHELSQKHDGSPLDIVGETLAELRVVQKRVQSQQERLKERGIMVLPNSYVPEHGDMVVIIQEGDFDGMEASVVASTDGDLSPGDILVMPSIGIFSGDLAPGGIDEPRPLVFKRHELGIWDYESVWEENDDFRDTNNVSESRRRLTDILSRVKGKTNGLTSSRSGEASSSSFNSSRERKAAKKTSGGKKRKS